MQPVIVIHLLECLVKARPEESNIQFFEGREDPGQELLERDRRGLVGKEPSRECIQRGRGRRVGGVHSDSNDGNIFVGREV